MVVNKKNINEVTVIPETYIYNGIRYDNYNKFIDLHNEHGWIEYIKPIYNYKTHKLGNIILVNKIATHEIIDLTPEEIAEQENQQQQELKRQAHDELLPTDWYVVRFIETGIPVPEEILQQRQEIRNRYS